MELIFVCPQSGRSFCSADYEIEDFRGVIEDDAGRKSLAARVRLRHPCPFCGERHGYRAADLPCPFAAGARGDGTSA